jgi:hypothetical protein
LVAALFHEGACFGCEVPIQDEIVTSARVFPGSLYAISIEKSGARQGNTSNSREYSPRATREQFQFTELNHATNRVIDNEQDNRAYYSNQQAVEIQARYAGRAEGIEEPASDHCSDNSKDDIKKDAFSRLVHELAADKARQ